MLRLSRCLQSALTLSLILCFALAVPVFAQNVTGAINGTVTDTTGAVIAGATVTAVDVDRHVNFSATTDSSGLYNITRVPVGRYEVIAEKGGFEKAKFPTFTLQLNQVAQVNVQLKAGSTSQTVEVEGAAPILETSNTELSTVIDSHATENIPLPTRNYGELTMLSPGAVNPNPGSFTGPQATFQSGRPYLNGNREQSNSYILDGMDNSEHDNNDVAYAPSVDAIQEFNLITQNAPADFGNYLGGVVNVTLKSGTDQIHGDAFEFLRNTILNANDWQNNLAGDYADGDEQKARSQVHWNTFGGTVGGPIIKDKLFFFIDYQGSQFHTGSAGTASVLDAAEKTGNFAAFCPAGFSAGICTASSATNVQLYAPGAGIAPTSRLPVANNNLTGAGLTLSPAALALVNSSFYPTPSGTGTDANLFNYHVATQNNGNQGDVKLDWLPSQKDHVMFRVSIMNQDNPTTPSYLLAAGGFTDFQYPLQNYVIDWTRTLTSNLVNDARVGLSHFPINQGYAEPGGNNFPSLFGISSPSNLLPGFNSGALTGTQNFYLGGSFGMGSNASALNKFADSELEVEDGLTWTKGKNEFHFGGEWIYYKDIFFYPGNEGVAGEMDFGPVYTNDGAVCPVSNPNCAGGAGEADFMLGLPNAVGIGQNCPTCASGVQTSRHVDNDMIAFYFQDNWRLTSKLTVNLGLRFEDTTPRAFYDNSAVNWTVFGGTPEISGVTTNDQALYNNYLGIADWQPRLGFAWQAWKNTVVRGAFGVSNFNETNGVNNLPSQNPPYTVSHNLVYGDTDLPGSTLSQGFTTLGGGACTTAGVQSLSAGCYSGVVMHVFDQNYRPEVSRQWNFSVQHQFGNATTLQVGYTGMSSYNLANIVNLAQPVTGPGTALVAGTVVGTTPSPFLNATELAYPGQKRYTVSNGISNYNAMQIVLAQRLAHGLQAQLNLTWSKCLGDTPGFFGNYGDTYGLSQSFGGWAFPQDTYNQRGDYGLCNYDARVDLNGYVIYDLPFGRGRQFANNMNKVLDGFVGGWSVQTDFTFHTGMPWDLLAGIGGTVTNDLSFAPRPDCVPGVPQHLTFQMAPASVVSAVGPAFQFLNPASVSNPTTSAFGDCPVDSHEGVGLKTMDLGISKHFHITERQNVELRVEANNFTNTPIFALPPGGGYWGTTLNTGSAGFGTVANSEGARQLQLALKYHF